MKNKRDYYDVLEINRAADAGTIKKAYRKLAKKYHPDSNQGNKEAEQQFKEITEAYNVLSDPKKKKLYDQFGHAAFDGSGDFSQGQGFSGFGTDPGSGYQEYHFEGGNMDDILKHFFGGSFGDSFGGTFGRGSYGGNSYGGNSFEGNSFGGDSFGGFRHSTGWRSAGAGGGSYGSGFSQKGQDLRAEIAISFDEAVFGCDKLLNLSGERGERQKTLQVHIPAGIEDGQSIRLKGKGYPGIAGGQPGDLFLKIHVGEKKGFQRKGSDIYSVVNIPFTTAALGGEVKVQTLYGDVICKIKEGTQSGSKIRLRGKGICSAADPGTRGDHYITVRIQVPQNLTQDSRRKLKEFEESMSRSRCAGVR